MEFQLFRIPSKTIVLLCIGFLLPAPLFAHEIELSFIAERDTTAFNWHGTESISIYTGDIITTTSSNVEYGVRIWNAANNMLDEFHLVILFGELGNRFRVLAKYFRPLNTEDVFGDDIFIDYPMDRRASIFRQMGGDAIEIGDTDKMWVPAYYREVLFSKNRNTLVEMVPMLHHHTGEGFFWYESTHADIQHGRAMFYNSIIRLGTDTHLPVKNIRRTNFGYVVDCVVSLRDRGRLRFPVFPESIFWEQYQPGEAVTLLLHLDGDYLDIYTYGSDIHVGTFIRVGREFIAQYQSLIRTNTVDLTNVQWPRRADGSMSVVPPTFPPIAQEVYETTYAEIVEGEAPAYVEEFFEEQAPAAAEADSEESGTPPWTLIGVIGGAVIIAGGAALVVAKRKRA